MIRTNNTTAIMTALIRLFVFFDILSVYGTRTTNDVKYSHLRYGKLNTNCNNYQKDIKNANFNANENFKDEKDRFVFKNGNRLLNSKVFFTS